MCLFSFENVSYTYLLVIIVLIQLFTSFGSLNALELPLELLHDGVNLPKSMDYARRMAFPLASSDVGATVAAGGIEMPPNVEDNMDFSSGNVGNSDDNNDDEHDDIDDDLTAKTEMAKWLQMQMQQEHQHTAAPHHHFQTDQINHRNSLQQNRHKHVRQQQQQHNSNRHLHNFPSSLTSSSSSVSPLRRCSIEISSKIPGICQTMGSVGNACVSGDYIDVFNAECL